jgi:hemerythrin-like domain-containing protein
MSQTMRRLRQDHANHSSLLAALERQVAVVERDDRPDWDLLQRIVAYCLTYPDTHHHPLEDKVLARLQAKNPAAAAPFAMLSAEHRALSAELRKFAAATEQVLQDATLPRAWFAGLARNFVVAEREHMRLEEAGFFPDAERMLGPADWADLDRNADSLPSNPLFDRPTDREFTALLADIKASEAAQQPNSGLDKPGARRPS